MTKDHVVSAWGHTFRYNDKTEQFTIDGTEMPSNRFHPSFTNGDDPDFIGVTNTDTNEFCGLSGKILKVSSPDDIKL